MKLKSTIKKIVKLPTTREALFASLNSGQTKTGSNKIEIASFLEPLRRHRPFLNVQTSNMSGRSKTEVSKILPKECIEKP